MNRPCKPNIGQNRPILEGLNVLAALDVAWQHASRTGATEVEIEVAEAFALLAHRLFPNLPEA